MGMCPNYLQDRRHFQSHVHQACGQGCIMTDSIAQRRLHVQASHGELGRHYGVTWLA